MSEIFVKTKKGIEEIEKHDSNLSLRMRRILIQVDGKRSVEDINELALTDDLVLILGQLENTGYISISKQLETNESFTEVESGLPKDFKFREIPATTNPKDIEQAKNFIMNTIYNFCGAWAHLSIIKAVSAANTHEELRESFIPWYNAIVETREGKRRAGELSASLLKVI